MPKNSAKDAVIPRVNTLELHKEPSGKAQLLPPFLRLGPEAESSSQRVRDG